MNIIMHRKKMNGIAVMVSMLFALVCNALAEPDFNSKTKLRLVKEGIWLETEISPQALLAVLPQADRNIDGRLDEDELSASRSLILSYYAQKVRLLANDRGLKADSTYFAFRSPAAPAAVPDRFYIYHWYAVLRRPETLQLTNRLFDDRHGGSVHQGAVIANDKILKFDFPPSGSKAVTFELDKTGEVVLLETDSEVLQAGYLWLGLGLSGLLALRMASSLRRKLRRQPNAAEREAEKMELEESAVYG